MFCKQSFVSFILTAIIFSTIATAIIVFFFKCVLKYIFRVQEAQASRVLEVRRENEDPLEPRERQDSEALQARQAPPDLPDPPGTEVHPDNLEHLERMELVDQLDPKDLEVGKQKKQQITHIVLNNDRILEMTVLENTYYMY